MSNDRKEIDKKIRAADIKIEELKNKVKLAEAAHNEQLTLNKNILRVSFLFDPFRDFARNVLGLDFGDRTRVKDQKKANITAKALRDARWDLDQVNKSKQELEKLLAEQAASAVTTETSEVVEEPSNESSLEVNPPDVPVQTEIAQQSVEVIPVEDNPVEVNREGEIEQVNSMGLEQEDINRAEKNEPVSHPQPAGTDGNLSSDSPRLDRGVQFDLDENEGVEPGSESLPLADKPQTVRVDSTRVQTSFADKQNLVKGVLNAKPVKERSVITAEAVPEKVKRELESSLQGTQAFDSRIKGAFMAFKGQNPALFPGEGKQGQFNLDLSAFTSRDALIKKQAEVNKLCKYIEAHPKLKEDNSFYNLLVKYKTDEAPLLSDAMKSRNKRLAKSVRIEEDIPGLSNHETNQQELPGPEPVLTSKTPPPAMNNALLAGIQAGKKLKKVSADDVQPKKDSKSDDLVSELKNKLENKPKGKAFAGGVADSMLNTVKEMQKSEKTRIYLLSDNPEIENHIEDYYTWSSERMELKHYTASSTNGEIIPMSLDGKTKANALFEKEESGFGVLDYNEKQFKQLEKCFETQQQYMKKSIPKEPGAPGPETLHESPKQQ